MASVTGVKELDRKLSRLRESVQRKISKAAVRKGLSEGAKEVKKGIPSQYKEARKAIGWTFRKDKRSGILTGKVGVAVGKKKAKLREWGEKVTAKRRAEGKKGLGVNPNTLHWFTTGTSRAPQLFPRLAASGMRSAKGRIRAGMSDSFRKGIMREASKA